MTTRLIFGIVIGMGIGALMGHFGKCSTGACPLTANPFRGAIYGGVMGALFAYSMAGSATPSTDTAVVGNSEASKVVHVNSSEDFQRYVVNASQPCMADFYSNGCGPCRMLAPTVEKLAEKYDGQAVVCKVSLDVAPELAKPYGIRGIPAVLFFENGKEVKRLVGLRRQKTYEKIIDAMLAKHQ